jgi:Raf kinase inhibitor-like YbhB/YbcL family protein
MHRHKNNKLIFQTDAFYDNKIASKYTCDGEDISPLLLWHDTNQNVGGYVLIVDDPDAQKVVGKTFVHWIVFMPPHITSLPEGVSSKEGSSLFELDPAIHEVHNDYGQSTYRGPCPPEEQMHTYRFTLFAVKESVDKLAQSHKLKAPFTADDFRTAMADEIIEEASFDAKYKRMYRQ